MTEFAPIAVTLVDPSPIALSVIDTGTPGDDRPALLAIHGVGGRKEQWREQISYFGSRHRVIAPDLRGHNQSEAAPPYTIDQITSDLIGVLRERRVRTPVALLAHSYGGVFALHLAQTHPDLIDKLVLIGVAERFNYGLLFKLATLAPVPGAWLESARVLLFRRKFNASAPVMRALMRQALLPWRGWERLDLIQQPVLALAGKLDVVAPPLAVERMVRQMPNARLEVVLNVKHKMHLQRPNRTNRLIEAFLGESVTVERSRTYDR